MRFLALLAVACLSQPSHPDCPRGDASPWFQGRHADVVSRSWEQKSRIEAVERVELRRGMHVSIEHAGCEYYTVVIRVGTATPGRGAATHYASAAAALLALAEGGADSAFDLRLAAETLRAAAPRFGQDLPVEGDGTEFLQTVVTVREPEAGAAVVEFTLSKGPL
jgi:hypothetical protein